MKLLNLILAMVLGTSLAGTAWSQSDSTGSTPRILGYLNPTNNSFQPLGTQPITSPAAVSTVTGKIVTNFTITVASAIAQTTPISCGVEATVPDENKATFTLSNDVIETAAVIATRSSATAAKCTVTIPYSWRLSNPTTDTVQILYQIGTIPSASTPGLTLRFSSQFIAIIPVPKTGTTTTETVAATI